MSSIFICLSLVMFKQRHSNLDKYVYIEKVILFFLHVVLTFTGHFSFQKKP